MLFRFLWNLVATATVALTAWAVALLVERLWLRPQRLERALRAQGLHGNRYRFPLGDLKELPRHNSEARRKHMSHSHDIAAFVIPSFQRALSLHQGQHRMSFIWFGPYPNIIVMDPEMIKEVLLNKFNHFHKPHNSVYFFRFVARGVASYDGEKWAKHRRIINPAFHPKKLKVMLPAFSTSCDELINRWEELTSADNQGWCELDVFPEFQRFTGDVISRAAFGNRYREGQRIFEMQSEQVELVLQSFKTDIIPGFRFLPTSKNRRRNKIFRETVALLKQMIGQREIAMRKGEATPNDLLGLLMEANKRDSQFGEETSSNKNDGMTTEEMIECKLFYFAGTDTISSLLAWTMVVLSMHPNWQKLAREEVLQVFGQNKPDFAGLSQLKIVTMILYEVLRLYPPISFFIR